MQSILLCCSLQFYSFVERILSDLLSFYIAEELRTNASTGGFRQQITLFKKLDRQCFILGARMKLVSSEHSERPPRSSKQFSHGMACLKGWISRVFMIPAFWQSAKVSIFTIITWPSSITARS